jgi:hypothetical protein
VATTGSNFIQVNGSTGLLVGSTVTTPPFVAAMNPVGAMNEINVAVTPAIPLDRFMVDLAMTSIPPPNGTSILPIGQFAGAYALNGCGYMTLATTVAGNIDLTDLTLAADARYKTAGDTTFAKIGCLVLFNFSATALVLSPGASNPASFPVFTGTTPTLSIPAAVTGVPGVLVMRSPTLVTVDSTHKILTVTPTAGGTLSFAVGGA